MRIRLCPPALLAWVLVFGPLLASLPEPVRAQGSAPLVPEAYAAWRLAHAADLVVAVSPLLADDTTSPAALAALGALVDAAARVRPPEARLFDHASYLVAVERLRLTAAAIVSARATARPALRGELEARRVELQVVAAGGQAPPERPIVPDLSPPAAPAAGLARAEARGVELVILDIARSQAPPGPAPTLGDHEYLIFRFRLTNLSPSDLPYFPLADATLVFGDGSSLQAVALAQAERFETGELAPGDALVSNVAFLVPRAARLHALRWTTSSGIVVEVTLP